jgi:tetratricopeptide (TPR) repeat protein
MKMSIIPELEVLYLENAVRDSLASDTSFFDVSADVNEELILKAKNSLLVKKHDEALEAFQIILDLDPDYSEAYLGQGYTFLDMGLRKSGMHSLKKAARLGNKNAIEFLRLEEFSKLRKTKTGEMSEAG